MANPTRPDEGGQIDLRDCTDLYIYHVNQAAEYEQKANKEMERWKAYFRKKNPRAGVDWINVETSNRPEVKNAVGQQQFHARQATMYGLGMLAQKLP